MFSGTKINISEESARCLLCYDAPCSNACGHGFKPDKAVRAVRFDNVNSAASEINQNVCAECVGECERACIHYDFPVRIREIIRKLPQNKKGRADLSIEFCGVKCENPFFLSSSIVAANYDMIARAFDAGWGGAVFKTIGKYVVHEVSPRFDAIKKDATPFAGFKNLEQISEHALEENLEVISRLKKQEFTGSYPEWRIQQFFPDLRLMFLVRLKNMTEKILLICVPFSDPISKAWGAFRILLRSLGYTETQSIIR